MKIGKDKILHFAVNVALGLTSIFQLWLAIGLCVGASLGKEYGDSKSQGNKWDWWDILADAIGAVVGIIIGLIVRRLIHG